MFYAHETISLHSTLKIEYVGIYIDDGRVCKALSDHRQIIFRKLWEPKDYPIFADHIQIKRNYMRAKLMITLLIVLMMLVIATFGELIYCEHADHTSEAILLPKP